MRFQIVDQDERFANAMMRMVGVDPAEAQRVAGLPLPELRPSEEEHLGPVAD